jgi:MFS family permease
MPRLPFLCVLLTMGGTFLATGVLIPLLPLYITDGLGAGESALGLTVLVYAVAGVLARPFAGTYLRVRDPWRLLEASAGAGFLVMLVTPLVKHMAWMYVTRAIEGFALGMIYLAGTTAVVSMTPVGRQGRGLSLLSVPLFLGIALGPILGDQLIRHWGYWWTWIGAAGLLALAVPAALVGSVASRRSKLPPPGKGSAVPPLTRTDVWNTLAHPAALVPAGVIVLLVVGWATFQVYVPLYGPTLGMAATGTVFLVHSLVVLAIRVLGADLFDRLPLVELALAGAVASALGLLVAWLWVAKPAIYVTAMLLGVAVGLTYTTLLRVALAGVDRAEQGAVIGAYSVAYDLGTGLGTAAVSMVVAATGNYRVVFLIGAICAAASVVLLVTRLWRRRRRYWPVIPPREPALSPG